MRAAVVLSLFLLQQIVFAAAQKPRPKPAPPEDSVYVYDVFRDAATCADAMHNLRPLPLRPTLILSLEQGPEFILDRSGGEEQLACVLEALRASGRQTKGMLLQDPVFLEQDTEAARRAARVAEFAKRHPKLLAGVVVDVEPHANGRWSCCSDDERRALLRDLQSLLAKVREQLRGLPLGVVLAWWYPALGRELPEAAPQAFFRTADEIYLMVYGDEGGPVVGGSAERVLTRLDAPEFFPGIGRMHLSLASYEFRSPVQLDADLQRLRQQLAARPGFAGTALFHAAAQFNAPLVRMVEGTITDAEGKGVAGVEIQAGSNRAESNSCGQFSLRGLPAERAELSISKAGFRPRTLAVDTAAPGEIRDLGKIALERDAADSPDR